MTSARLKCILRFTSLCLTWLAIGCAMPTTGDVVPGGGGSNNAAATNSAGSAVSGDSARPAASSDALTAEFPACSVPDQAREWKITILDLVNRERSKVGAPTLNVNATLEQEADNYACQMIQHDFFAHENPVDGSDLASRAQTFGYAYQFIGENLAAGQQSPEEAFTDWMNSPGHRENILNPAFVEIGISVRSGGTYGLYWVQEFGEPPAPAVQPDVPFR